MASYRAPGVYVQDLALGSNNIEQVSSSVGVMLGVTRSGVVGSLQKVTSWTEFISKYANGLDTPFLENSYLPYAVYGFFNNGGSELYIGSIKKSGVKATKTDSGITVTALTEGAWGNSVTIAIAKSSDWSSNNLEYDVTVNVGASDSAVIRGVYVDTIADAILNDVKVKNWIGAFTVASGSALDETTITLAGGSDGSALTDSDYTSALTMIDFVEDAIMVAIPGQTSTAVNSALISYCENHGLFPILDAPLAYTTDQVKAYRRTISTTTGVLAYPWGKITDPITGTAILVPVAGHLMGVYARTFEDFGFSKAPAGVDAVVNGFIELNTILSAEEVGTLNSVGVVCLCAKANLGIVVWGARSLNSSDPTMKYVTDGMLNLVIKKSLNEGTQFAVFEANTDILWERVDSACRAFLENLRLSGALKGSQDDAYYVVVDATNNTDESIADGILNVEIGYAPIKPAEFVIIKLAHSING